MFQKLIQTRGVKQKWLASQLGVSEVSVSNWMRGNHKPTEENLKKIATLLNIDIQLLKQAINEI
ncbi:MAG: helix-turn-helix transcriptional regulator [Bacteroidales bacterium]|jgi:transcriptional regulator with XRE-family HTH domain|nr:helix-turn-helix transcriptional regulator [Bacteroidales bacterium]